MQKLKNLDEIQHTEIFAVVKFWSGKTTEFLRQCYVILYDSIKSKIFQWFAVKIGKIRLLLGCKINGHFFRS